MLSSSWKLNWTRPFNLSVPVDAAERETHSGSRAKLEWCQVVHGSLNDKGSLCRQAACVPGTHVLLSIGCIALTPLKN